MRQASDRARPSGGAAAALGKALCAAAAEHRLLPEVLPEVPPAEAEEVWKQRSPRSAALRPPQALSLSLSASGGGGGGGEEPGGGASAALRRLELRLEAERRHVDRQIDRLERRVEEVALSAAASASAPGGCWAELQGYVDGLAETVQGLVRREVRLDACAPSTPSTCNCRPAPAVLAVLDGGPSRSPGLTGSESADPGERDAEALSSRVAALERRLVQLEGPGGPLQGPLEDLRSLQLQISSETSERTAELGSKLLQVGTRLLQAERSLDGLALLRDLPEEVASLAASVRQVCEVPFQAAPGDLLRPLCEWEDSGISAELQQHMLRMCEQVESFGVRLQRSEQALGLGDQAASLREAEREPPLFAELTELRELCLAEACDQVDVLRGDLEEHAGLLEDQVASLASRLQDLEQGFQDVATSSEAQQRLEGVGERALRLALRAQRAVHGNGQSFASDDARELRRELAAVGEEMASLWSRVEGAECGLGGMADALSRVCEELALLRRRRNGNDNGAAAEASPTPTPTPTPPSGGQLATRGGASSRQQGRLSDPQMPPDKAKSSASRPEAGELDMGVSPESLSSAPACEDGGVALCKALGPDTEASSSSSSSALVFGTACRTFNIAALCQHAAHQHCAHCAPALVFHTAVAVASAAGEYVGAPRTSCTDFCGVGLALFVKCIIPDGFPAMLAMGLALDSKVVDLIPDTFGKAELAVQEPGGYRCGSGGDPLCIRWTGSIVAWSRPCGLWRVYTPGRYTIGFYKEFIVFPTTLNTILFSDERPEAGVQQLSVLRSRDRDGKQIRLDISVQYRLNPDQVGQIYREYTVLYEDIYISELRGALQKATNNFAIAEAWESYAEVQKMLKKACTDVLLPRHAECWGLQLWGVRLEDRYEQALIRTQIRKQAQRTEEARKIAATARAKTEVILADYQKNVTIIEAGGNAQKVIIEYGAISKAKANLIAAQGAAMGLVQDIVRLNSSAPGMMTDAQSINYQRFIALDRLKTADLVVNAQGGGMQ
ncbi:unnamed protein product, partial [Polarella glacialis]